MTDERMLARWVSDTLRAGTILASAVIIVGVIARSSQVTWVGLLLLTLTPAAQVAIAAAVFAQQRERRYAITAGVAFGLLVVAFAIAVALSPVGGG